ncbi:MAG: hypothetical protein P1T08_08890 [Acidimicrobiia bacterium]|nr:hypothetical protein [Acidimicrobiia bacterium]
MVNPTAIKITEGTLPYPSATLDTPLLARIAELGGGLMLKGDRGASAAAVLRSRGYAGTLVLDPARYEQATSTPDQGSLFGDYDPWIRQQQAQGVTTFIAPSHGIGPREFTRVAEVLAAGKTFAAEVSAHGIDAEVVVPVNIYRSWVVSRCRELRDVAGDTPFTIGLLLTNPGDPLDRKGAVAGLTEVVRGLPGCAVLRTDLAGGLGALSVGARWVSIGTMPTHRHATKPGTPGFSPNVTDRTPSIVVSELLSFRKASKLEQLERVDPVLTCRCHVCKGADIRRFADPAYYDEGEFHNAAVVADLTNTLVAASDRTATWGNWCNRAVDTHAWVEQVTGVALPVPLAIEEWAAISST